MADFQLYSQREKLKLQADQPEVYQYDSLPDELLTQIIYIWKDAVGFYQVPSHNLFREGGPSPMNWFWEHVVGFLSREHGVENLGGDDDNYRSRCANYLRQMARTNIDRALDIIQVTFREIDVVFFREMSSRDRDRARIRLTPDDAIQELNKRFRQHAIGYQYESGQIFRQDSDYVHQEVVVPAITLLKDENFIGPLKEFMNAHDHYRHGRYDNAIGEASNALESTIRTIFDKRRVPYEKQWTANKLIRTFFDVGLVPNYLKSSFENLINTLQGLPTIRNNESGHGEGSEPRVVPRYLAEYALNAAAAAILFFIGASINLIRIADYSETPGGPDVTRPGSEGTRGS
jgi:hypothetical protein